METLTTSQGDFVYSLIEEYLKSSKFFGLTHNEVVDLLNRTNLSGIDEIQIYNAIIARAKAKSKCESPVENFEPGWRDLKKMIAPEGRENLLRHIRIPLFMKNQWIEIFKFKEALVLPLSLAQKTNFDEYFEASNFEREQIMALPDMAEFNFRPRESNLESQKFLLNLIDDYFKSPQFLGFTHNEVLDFLKKSNLSGVNEFQIYKTIITWAKATYARQVENVEPGWRDLKNLIAPIGGENLLLHVRIPLLTKNQWIEMFTSKEASILPISISQKACFDEYFDAVWLEKLQIQELPEMVQFKFEPRRSDQRPQPQSLSKRTSLVIAQTPTMQKNQSTFMVPDTPDFLENYYTPPTPRAIRTMEDYRPSERSIRALTCSPVTINKVKAWVETTNLKAAMKRRNPFTPRCLQSVTGNKRSKPNSHDILSEPLPSTSSQRRMTEDIENQVPAQMESVYQADVSSPRMVPVLPVDNVVSTSEVPEFVTTHTKFSEYIQHLDHQTQRIYVEFVVDDYLDGVGLLHTPQEFPDLKEFHLKFKFQQENPNEHDLQNRFKTFMQETIDLKKYLCFMAIEKTDECTYNTLWNSNVNISLEFHGCVIIKIDHNRNELVLNVPKNAKAILRGLRTVPLKTLALGSCKFSSLLNFKDVERLILCGVKGTTKFNNILLKCLSLTELSLWKNENWQEPVDLINIPNPEKLKSMALWGSDITVPPNSEKVFPNLEALHLNNSTHSFGLVTAFPKLFPNIKKLSIGQLKNTDGRGISLEFLLIALQIESLEWVRVENVDWTQPKSKGKIWTEFKKLTGLKERGSSSFVLIKRRDFVFPFWTAQLLNDKEDPKIQVPGGYYDTMYAEEVEFYKLNTFYLKFSDTVPASFTYANFCMGVVK